MRKVFLMITTALACLTTAFVCELSAQDYVAPEVIVSKEKVKLDGKIYYSHIVAERQTLYSISKAYGVTIDDIYAANPTLKETGLKKNAIILIPSPDIQEEVKTTAKEEKAAKKEAKKEEKARVAAEKKKNDYFIHTVKWYEDLDAIAAKYGISIETLMKFNDLTGRKLTNRQKLKIPTMPEAFTNEPVQAVAESLEDTNDVTMKVPATKPVGTTEKQESPIILTDTTSPRHYSSRDKINAVLLLPFNAQGEKPSENNMDFYSGALLAAKDLGNSGLNIELSVYDTGNGTLPITAERLGKSDVIIGPVSSKELTELLAKTPETSYVISPLDPHAEVLVNEHRNFIQAPPSACDQYEDIISWIKEDLTADDKIVVIYEKGTDDSSELKNIKELISTNGMDYSTFSYNILEGRNILESLGTKMTGSGQNRVIIASESEAFVNDIIRNLNLMIHNKYSVILYGISKIRSFETIDVENLHNTQFHASLSYYIDYDNPQVRDFLMKYRALYNTEPTPFAFQGYDTMYYFCALGAKYGTLWPQYMVSEKTTQMLQSDFGFVQKENGGLYNKAVRRIIYTSDYQVNLIEK